MIVNLTDTEALALSQRLSCSIKKNEGLDINQQELDNATEKLLAAMKKSDAMVSKSLDSAISNLEASGFDQEQINALKGAKEKAQEHNSSKYNR